MVKVHVCPFGQALDPITNKLVQVSAYTLTNSNKMSVTILDRGATVYSIKLPDKYGKIDDICLGLATTDEYIRRKDLYMGATLGRVANRVSKGQFDLDAKTIQLTKNFRNKYHINGGFTGFDSMIWKVKKNLGNGIVMRHVNPHCHEGYPGNLAVTITFTLDDCNRFGVLIEITSDKKTAVNIANHIYLNLAGHKAQKEGITQHNIIIKAKEMVEIDDDQLPTGRLVNVKHTLYDLGKYTNIGRRLDKFIDKPIPGFDHTYCLESPKCTDSYVSKIIHPCTGRYLEVYTDRPGLHFYTARHLPDLGNDEHPVKAKDKAVYIKNGAFCIQPQNFPDAVNYMNFPTAIIEPNQKNCIETVYKFGVHKN